jgi:hypothetical protein
MILVGEFLLLSAFNLPGVPVFEPDEMWREHCIIIIMIYNV